MRHVNYSASRAARADGRADLCATFPVRRGTSTKYQTQVHTQHAESCFFSCSPFCGDRRRAVRQLCRGAKLDVCADGCVLRLDRRCATVRRPRDSGAGSCPSVRMRILCARRNRKMRRRVSARRYVHTCIGERRYNVRVRPDGRTTASLHDGASDDTVRPVARIFRPNGGRHAAELHMHTSDLLQRDDGRRARVRCDRATRSERATVVPLFNVHVRARVNCERRISA